jgi:putative ABC transport system permease protein
MAHTRRPGSLADRLYNLLLRFFPAEFRGDFGGDMAMDFRDEYRAAEAGGLGAVLRLWLRTLPAMIRTAVRQHADALSQDVRHGLRAMGRTPGFATVAILMLALGTGVNAAMYSVVDAVMLRSPFTDPGRIVIIRVQTAGQGATSALSVAQFGRLERAAAFASIATLDGGSALMTGLGDARHVSSECVGADMLKVLGSEPLLGRWFTAEEDRPGGPSVVVLGYGFWQREFAGREDTIGRVLTLNGTPVTVIGVMPRGFLGAFSRNSSELWAPLGAGRDRETPAGCRLSGIVNAFARVKAPLSVAAAEQLVNATSGIQEEAGFDDRRGAAVSLESLKEQTLVDVRTPLLALVGAVAFVLLIACANVANFQLERTVGRRREMAVRLALGASRGRVMRQVVTENLLLALVGGAAGLAAARLSLPALVALVPTYVPHLNEIDLNGRVLAVILALTSFAGVLIGIIPGLQATAPGLAGDLKDSARTSTRGSQWTRRVLVAIEVAASVVLLIGAGLMIQTFLTLRPSRPGFETSNRLTATLRLPSPRLGAVANPANVAFVEDALERLRLLPGVHGVSLSTYLPMSGMVNTLPASALGTTAQVYNASITPNYFDEMAIAVLRGRRFQAADDARAMPVAIVNEAAASRFWPAGQAVGQTIAVKSGRNSVVRTVVGIIANTRMAGSDTRSRAELYVPYLQEPTARLNFVLRTAGEPDSRLGGQIRAVVSAISAAQVVDRIETVQTIVDRTVSRPRFGASLFGLFAAMAALLAGAGLAATIAWWVSQRTREIGVRMALGANPATIARLILRQALAVTGAGVVLGLFGAMAATRMLAGWLYGVTPFDALTYAGGALAMMVIAAVASYLPARRAVRIDPLVTLRAE